MGDRARNCRDSLSVDGYPCRRADRSRAKSDSPCKPERASWPAANRHGNATPIFSRRDRHSNSAGQRIAFGHAAANDEHGCSVTYGKPLPNRHSAADDQHGYTFACSHSVALRGCFL